MIILDTNVLAELTRPVPHPAVLAWLDAQPTAVIATTTVTVFEMLGGVLRLPEEARREALGEAVSGQLAAFGDRILPFDLAAAAEAADIATARGRSGRPMSVQDAQIAGIVRSRAFTLVTRNTRDFEGVGIDLVDPWSV